MQVPADLQALVLDLDGLLIDSETWSWKAHDEVLASYGLDPLSPHEIGRMVGLIGLDEWNELCSMRALPDVRIQYNTAHTGAYIRISEECHGPMPGIDDLLRAASHVGLRVALASNSPLSVVRDVLRKLSILDVFAATATGDQVARSKPAPDVYRLALRLLCLPATSVLAIEDSRVGLQAARAAGIKCLVVPNDVTATQDFSGAYRRFAGLADVAVWLVGGRATRERPA